MSIPSENGAPEADTAKPMKNLPWKSENSFSHVQKSRFLPNGKISYRASRPLSLDNDIYKSLINNAPNDHLRSKAIVSCLKHFHWNWVVIIIPADGSADQELQELTKEFTRNGICIENVYSISPQPTLMTFQLSLTFRECASKIIIVCGRFQLRESIFAGFRTKHFNKTFILPESFLDSPEITLASIEAINCSLVFEMEKREVPGLQERFQNINKFSNPGDSLLDDIYLFYFHCNTTDVEKKQYLYDVEELGTRFCQYSPDIVSPFNSSLFDINNNYGSFYSIYRAVYSLAYAVQERQSMDGAKTHGYRGKLQKYVRANKETRTYNEDGELSSPLIVSSLTFHKSPNGRLESIRTKTAGTFTETSTGEMTFHINPEAITWKNGVVPVSRCNKRCPPGFRKAPGNSRHVCCYECLPCAEGEISIVTDSENCQRCPDQEWPNEKKTTCIPKTLEYLSYEGDNLTLVFCIMSLLGIITTAILLKVFISYWDTPIVKANNRTVSIILLASILLSFLSVFLFLGCPIGITCILRQTSFGIIFSISVSCVLAKTIVVCIAFKATKPGSHWKKWVGQKLSNCVVITCSSVQVLICIIWLSVSPPYQEYDMFSHPGKIIIQCNEGSVIGFYSVLGYMGFLAAVSFILAFMVRTLPDSFNEAKYITFSTLVFCSVWIAMIPAYLSTRGKYMVAVEEGSQHQADLPHLPPLWVGEDLEFGGAGETAIHDVPVDSPPLLNQPIQHHQGGVLASWHINDEAVWWQALALLNVCQFCCGSR
ncbi:vomeronasal type-2 receptor 26-like [Hyperolius riggenbachi]|uniref:vomeronasal type-2 receptor 26-like n=1 Tax=Hyperolius riggenbachi TaxID=752182 RepID=UPI0035A2E025